MDGVLADFFSEYAKLAGVTTGTYRDIPPAKVDPTLDKMIGTDFFSRLPMFKTAPSLIKLVLSYTDHYNICSSPLRGDHGNSEKHKRIWIKQHLVPQPVDIIITGRKESYAVQSDGTPNVLIDDRGKNIEGWINRGGIGIKYQADEDSLNVVKSKLDDYYKEDEQEPTECANWHTLELNKLEESLNAIVKENFADGKKKGKSRPGRVKKAGASCKGSVTDLRKKAAKYGGEKGKMYHWCANMKGGKK